MGFGNYSPDYHKPFNKKELVAIAQGLEGTIPIFDAKLCGKNTLRYKNGVETVYLYHKTRILRLHQSGSVTVKTGGYNTVTTRSRLNDFLPDGWRVHTSKGVMRLSTPAGAYPITGTESHMFRADGTPFHASALNEGAALIESRRKLIDGFIKGMDKLESLPEPNGGDPWTVDWNPRCIGDEVLTDWLKTHYVNGSLILAALRRKGYGDAGISMFWHDWNHSQSKSRRYQIRKAVRDYFKAGFGIA